MEAETAAFGYPSRARISRPAPSSAERRAAVSQTATQPVAKCSNGSILEPERFAPIEVTTFLENRFCVQRFPATRSARQGRKAISLGGLPAVAIMSLFRDKQLECRR